MNLTYNDLENMEWMEVLWWSQRLADIREQEAAAHKKAAGGG